MTFKLINLEGENLEEEEMGLSIKIVYFHSLFFLFLLMVFFHIEIF